MTYFDRRACRDYMHLVLSQLAVPEVPLLWHYLAYRNERVLACFNEDQRAKVRGLVQAWACLLPMEQRDVMAHFATILEELARHLAALPRKGPG
jgi:hypothetical protein